jgi:hypothetical protein
MATITTSTSTLAVAYPGQSSIDRNVDTGDLWAVVRTAATQISIFKSTDAGGSWTSQGSFTRTGLYDLGEARIDTAGEQLHIVWVENVSSTDRIMYKRVDIRSGTADLSPGEFLVTGASAAAAGDFFNGCCVVPIRNPDGSFYVLVPAAFHGALSGVFIYPVLVRNQAAGFSTSYVSGLVQSTKQYRVSGSDSAITVSADWEHNGDGTTSGTPNVWISFQIGTTAYAIKLAWQGSKSGWTSPSGAPIVSTGRLTAARDFVGRWDGKRFVTLSVRPSDTTKIDVFERNAANTGNAATRLSPAHPQGAITSFTLGYNHVTQDLRLFCQGTSTTNVYYVDYIRATNTWGSWVQASATAALASRHGVRRSTAGTAQFDQYQQQGGASPYSIVNNGLAVNFAPQTPTWITGIAGTVPTNGAAADVSASLLFDWTYSDPNPADVQSQYALQRQIGAAAAQWWRTSDSTWQSAETFNASATSAVTLTSGQWVGGLGAADPAHVYRVAVKDAGGLTSAYSAGLSVVPSTRVDPTLTAPTGGSILNTGLVTVTWTNTEQSAYRIILTNTATGTTVWDSGFLAGDLSVLSYQVPVTLIDGFQGQISLQTKNAEGLASVIRTATFSIDFVEPVAPLVTVLAAVPNSGGINVAVSAAAPSGAQPATSQTDIYHRVVSSSSAIVNSNPYIETNANDWNNVSYGSMVRSTVLAHQGTASLLVTPNGAQATPYINSVAPGYAAVPGELWEGRAWVRSTTATKGIRIRLQWYDASSAFLSETTRDMTPVAGVWLFAILQASAPASTAYVRLAVGQMATPAAGDTMYIDELALSRVNLDQGVRIVAGAVSATTYLDWRTVTGVDYEYRGYAEATNGTEVWGPWQS